MSALHVYTCQFVVASDVFQDCPNAWQLFQNTDIGETSGEHSRTLVTAQAVIDALEKMAAEDEEIDERELVLERLQALPEDMYIDLEN